MVWGCSLGGGVTTLLREKYPFTYDGAISCAGVVSDPELAADASLAFGLAYDVTFGWPSDKWGPLEDVRDDLTFFGDVAPILSPQIMNPANKAKWEFVRLVMKLPVEAFWMPDPQTTLFVALAMWKATEQRASAEAGAGGVVVQNRNHAYTLTTQDKAYLASLGLTNAEELLAQMNARTNIDADHSARRASPRSGVRTATCAGPSSRCTPLTTGSRVPRPRACTWKKCEKSHDEEQLVQVFTSMPGHCSFSTQQYLAVLAAMERWLDTGDKPQAAAFPSSLGFAPGYVPAPWPFPEPRCRHQWPWHRHDRWGNCLR